MKFKITHKSLAKLEIMFEQTNTNKKGEKTQKEEPRKRSISTMENTSNLKNGNSIFMKRLLPKIQPHQRKNKEEEKNLDSKIILKNSSKSSRNSNNRIKMVKSMKVPQKDPPM